MLKESEDEGIAIFDLQKNLLFSNDKFQKVIKSSENLSEHILFRITLKSTNMSFNSELKFKKSNSFLEINKKFKRKTDESENNISTESISIKLTENSLFQDNKSFSLDQIFNEIISIVQDGNRIKTFLPIPSESSNITLHLDFEFVNEKDVLNLEEFYKAKLFLTVFLNSGKIQAFLINIRTKFQYNEFFNEEKKNQNKKIFLFLMK